MKLKKFKVSEPGDDMGVEARGYKTLKMSAFLAIVNSGTEIIL